MKPRPTPNAYAGVDDLAIVTCYFNPAGYATRLENFGRFREPIIAAGLHLAVIECTFGDRPRELPPAWGAAHVVARDVLWQKERLLNIAIAALPERFTKVAWIDADVLFANPDWARDASHALEDVAVVQPFADGVLLPRDQTGREVVFPGFAAAVANDPACLFGPVYIGHGHTGLAWAARRTSLAEHGLYDRCVSGSADHVMAHAFCGDWRSACVTKTFGEGSAMLAHFHVWAERAYRAVRASVAAVPGTILHQWHGELKHRRYDRRYRELIRQRFDPDRDVAVAANGTLAWSGRGDRLRRWGVDYFRRRREDGR